MKKMFVVIVLVVGALAVLGIGGAAAQAPQPPVSGQTGPLHEYMTDAMARALGMSAAEFEAQRQAGKTAYQIALGAGFAADKIPALLSGARLQALDAAAAAGVITQQQATWMKSRGAGMGQGLCNGTGQPIGGMFGRGGRWQQANP